MFQVSDQIGILYIKGLKVLCIGLRWRFLYGQSWSRKMVKHSTIFQQQVTNCLKVFGHFRLKWAENRSFAWVIQTGLLRSPLYMLFLIERPPSEPEINLYIFLSQGCQPTWKSGKSQGIKFCLKWSGKSQGISNFWPKVKEKLCGYDNFQ